MRQDLAEFADADAVEHDFVDLGEASAFEVVAGEGECASGGGPALSSARRRERNRR